MTNRILKLALLAGASTLFAAPALAQEGAVPAPATPEETAARTAFLEAQMEAMQAELAELKKQVAEGKGSGGTEVSWKGAPLFEDKEKGWSFKPRGRLQYDVGHVGSPEGIQDRGLGFGNEARRIRLGVEGDMPYGFGYKFEVDFADNGVDITDAIITWAPGKSVSLAIGQQNNFQSLEELTSSRFSSFIERAAFTDAFGFERRVGLSSTFKTGDLMVQAGLFTDNINDLTGDENNSFGFDGRVVYAPKLGSGQLHVGASAHYRDLNDLFETGTTTRYRQRPLVHFTDTRFLATPALGVKSETSYGAELAYIKGPFHAAGEVHWLNANRGDPESDLGFFGGYAELGWYLTGETRGYKNGTFDRTKVKRPVGDGGMGAFQINARYDYLDLNDETIFGGKQKGYQLGVTWIPMDYVRFLVNYAHLAYDDAAIATATGDRDYSVDVVAARAQIDF